MKERPVARVYAAVLWEVGQAGGLTSRLAVELGTLVRLYQEPHQFCQFLASPRIRAEEKTALIDRVFGPAFAPALVRFLHTLIERERTELLPWIVEEFHALQDRTQGQVHVEVVTPQPIQADLEAALTETLEQRLKKQVLLHSRLDPHVLGGLRLQVGDLVFNGTLSRRLEQLADQLYAAVQRKESAG